MSQTKVVLDSSILTVAFDRHSSPPTDLSGNPVEFAKEKVIHFLDSAAKNEIQIILPTPVIAEILTASSVNQDALFALLSKSDAMCIQSFDNRAALTHAKLAREYDPKKLKGISSKQAVKFDRQIIAIGELHNAETIYTADQGMHKYASKLGLTVKGVDAMPLPPHIAQPSLHLVSTNEIEEKV